MCRKDWNEMTDGELKEAIKEICRRFQSCSEVNRFASKTLGYPFQISVLFGNQNNFLAVFSNKDGQILNIEGK